MFDYLLLTEVSLILPKVCIFLNLALPQIQYVNDKPYHLMQSTECRGGKIYEINQVQVRLHIYILFNIILL